ncbi:MAG: beta-N-acetylglucosaminidase domain-containing protein [Akkermansia sp.]
MKSPLHQLRHVALTSLSVLGLIHPSWADSPKVYPTPQQVNWQGQGTQVKHIQLHDAKDCPSELPKKEGAYALRIHGDTLHLYTRDQAGAFYAKQSIIQLLQGVKESNNAQHDPFADKSLQEIITMGSLPQGEIMDWPDLPYRGSVEGYYGQPWSHAARIAQLQFYGRNKLNTYIWAAKDDPYHHGYRCREPYPADVAQQISELCEVAKQNHVKFIWAIHPANTVDWAKNEGKDDLDSLCAKLELMHKLGVRHFGVFVDDSSGEINKASRQGQLCSYIHQHFIQKHKDVGPLIMCPTGYNRAWTSPQWMGELGQSLAPDIRVMWTGNTVVHDITKEGQEWVAGALGRPTFIWWNWPCTDYCRSHVGMGRTYGLDQSPQMKELMTGFVANPMEWPEASKIGLFGVADYCWNIEDFQSTTNWQDGIQRLFPSCAGAMQHFCNNNSDLGRNVHHYNREESVHLAKDIQDVQEGLDAGQLPAEATQRVIHECQGAIVAAQELQRNSDITTLRGELDAWFAKYGQLGQVGVSALTIIKGGPNTKELGILLHAWHWFSDFGKSEKKPKVASRHLAPMVEQAANIAASQCYASITGDKDYSYHGTQFISSVGDYQTNGDKVMDANTGTNWLQNSAHKKGDWYMLDFGIPTDIKEIQLLMGSNKSPEAHPIKGQFESSMDGENWHPLAGVQTGGSIELNFKTPIKATQLRYRVLEAGTQWTQIREFSVEDKTPQRVKTDVAGWKNALPIRNEKFVGIGRIMEVAHMEAGQSISLSVKTPVKATWLEINLDCPDILDWAAIDVTLEDGSEQRLHFLNSETENTIVVVGKGLPQQGIRSMRLTNTSGETRDVKLNMFKMDCPPDDNRNIVENMTDGDILSSWNASELKRHRFYGRKDSKAAVIIGTGVNQLIVQEAPNAPCQDRTQIVVPLNGADKTVTLLRKEPVAGERRIPIYIHEVIFVK